MEAVKHAILALCRAGPACGPFALQPCACCGPRERTNRRDPVAASVVHSNPVLEQGLPVGNRSPAAARA